MHRVQLAVAGGVLGLAVILGAGAAQFKADTGYAGIGPSFIPWIVCALLGLCGLLLAWQAWTGGFRNLEVEATPAEAVRWHALAIASAGLLLNAALITRIGFSLSCALLFVLMARAFGDRRWLRNVLIGLTVSLPVYWLFHFGLGLHLPSLLPNGWF